MCRGTNMSVRDESTLEKGPNIVSEVVSTESGIEHTVTSKRTNQDGQSTWSLSKRLFHTIIPGYLLFVMTFSTSVTVPATGLIAAQFKVTRTESLLVLTLYTLGIGVGPLFIAPLSEVLGRKWLYSMTAIFLLVFTAAAAAAPSFGSLLAFRLLAGTLGSAGIAIGGATIVDVWGMGKKSGLAGMCYIICPFLAPTLGPLAGAYMLHNKDDDWRWNLWLVCILAAPAVVGSLFMSETSNKLMTKGEGSPVGNPGQVLTLVGNASLRAIKLLLTDPIVLLLTIYTAYAYAMVFSYFASATYILSTFYGFDSRQVGLSLLSVIVGYFLAAILFIIFDHTFYARACVKAEEDGGSGIPEPEHRLYSAMAGSVFLPAGLFWYAWAAREGGNWAILVASGVPFGIGSFSLLVSAIQYMVNIFQAKSAASALAANGLLRFTVGAVFPLFTLPMYQALGVHWAGSIFAFGSLLLLPIPWVLFKWGHILRARRDYLA